MGRRLSYRKSIRYGRRPLCSTTGKELASLIEWHFSQKRIEAVDKINAHDKVGIPINEEYYKKRPSVVEGLTSPLCTEEARDIYTFILDNQHYTVNRGVGMGADVAIAPDMLKLCARGDKKGIDIDRYEKYCFDFVNSKSRQEQKKKD